jgi:hypothetical protein
MSSSPIVMGQNSPAVAQPTGSPWRAAPHVWLWLSIAAALVAMAGNVVGLQAIDRIYGSAYPSLTDQAIAQDLVNLVIVAPTLITLAALAWRGSLRAYLAWLGLLVFTVYNYVIYTFAIHFGPLFLVWVGVLGLALFALIGGVTAIDPSAVKARFTRHSMGFAAWFMIVMAVLFGTLWLSDIVPALLSGDVPATATDMGVPTNPVHVLDLAFFLPAALTAGLLLLNRRPLAYAMSPAVLLFLALTGLPILATPFVADARGDPVNWMVTIPISIVTATSLVTLARMLSAVPSGTNDAGFSSRPPRPE